MNKRKRIEKLEARLSAMESREQLADISRRLNAGETVYTYGGGDPEDSHTPEEGQWECEICGEIDKEDIRYTDDRKPYHVFSTGDFIAPTHAVKWLPDEPKQQELEPCPFCGGMAQMTRGFDEEGHRGYFHTCVSCGIQSDVCFVEAEAIEAWNRRADEPKAQEVSSLDDMEKYVGMLGYFWNGTGVRFLHALTSIEPTGFYADGGGITEHFEPHPQSIELLKLRKDNAELSQHCASRTKTADRAV